MNSPFQTECRNLDNTLIHLVSRSGYTQRWIYMCKAQKQVEAEQQKINSDNQLLCAAVHCLRLKRTILKQADSASKIKHLK